VHRRHAVGVWADRFGPQADAARVRVLFVASIWPAYLVLTAPGATPAVIIAMNMLDNFIFATCIGAAYALLAEAFPRSVRSSGPVAALTRSG
jgi:MFS family permease